MISVKDIDFTFNSATGGRDGLKVLNQVSFDVRPGEVTVVCGPSGCGKTTLLNVIAGLLQESSGTVIRDESSKAPVGYVFQDATLIPWRSVRSNALYGAEVAGRLSDESLRRCDELLSAYGLAGFEHQYPASLSGGMQQRVSIIRAVLSGAKCILLDEPFSNTDFVMRHMLHNELSRLVDEEQLCAILVTHDIDDAMRLADQCVVLTERPASIRTILRIPISRSLRLEGSVRMLPELEPYYQTVWQALADSRGAYEGTAQR